MDFGGPGPATALQEPIQMWDDGHAGQLMAGQDSASSGAVSRSLGRLKRSISNAIDKLKRK